jgi:hypothetical protein
MFRIADVYLDDTISELATRRPEFSSIIRAHGIDGLVAALNKKTETLAQDALGSCIDAEDHFPFARSITANPPSSSR